ncbi:hypothetical protein AB0H07_01555 [Streptomyces sp. NPDC021354]|uniref:hypothetical protein n=1 Tax=Streptomyces sp. NPDC021354 TaxID=3154793 RepID=UPI0033D3E41B
MAASVRIDGLPAGYSVDRAYWLAQASDLAYKDEATIEQQARAWGFTTIRHHRTRFTPPFPLEDTQAYTLASETMIVTAFRGTEPAQIKDWLSDATTPPWPGPAHTGYVHYGFAEALWAGSPDRAKGLTADLFAPASDGVRDHSIHSYLAALEKNVT